MCSSDLAEVQTADGGTIPRDMNVVIKATDASHFNVSWTSTTYRADGTTKDKSYSINFSQRGKSDVYEAAMKRDLFGNDIQLDPMKGEPYVWGRIIDDTLTVYSLTVDTEGGYDLQQFDRKLAEGGLELTFQNIHNGTIARSVTTFLKKQ